MNTQIITHLLERDANESIQEATRLLNDGKLVAIPTETVYGLSCDASNVEAIKKIFEVKRRPLNHPLILHLNNIDQLPQWAIDIPDITYRLAKQFWPGPLSVLLKKHPSVPDVITGGSANICIRIPNHPVMQALFKEFKGSLVAPSANLYGQVSPTTAEHVMCDLNGKISAVLDGGPCKIGVESTIIDLTKDNISLLRPGGLSIETIEDFLGHQIDLPEEIIDQISGNMINHYQPKTRLYTTDDLEIKKISNDMTLKNSVFLLLNDYAELALNSHQMPNDAQLYGQIFYATLRLVDGKGYDSIYVEIPPKSNEWMALIDRIMKASFKH